MAVKVAYQPARLVEGNTRWYILFYAQGPDGEVWKRYRETYGLNRIHNIPARRRRGGQLVDKINWWLEVGRQPWLFNEIEANIAMTQQDGPELGSTPAVKAIENILEIKCTGARKNSKRSFRSTYGLLIQYLKDKGYATYPINKLSQVHAAAYMDYRLLSGIGNSTYNNNLSLLRGCWIALEKRGYVDKLIFKNIEKRKPKPKNRRAFTNEEARVVFKEVQKVDQLLFLGLIMEYCCYIRPVELRRLRKYHVDRKKRIIEVPGREAKSYEERYPAIPESFIDIFYTKFWDKIPSGHLIFGRGWQSHPDEPCGDNKMYNEHKKILKDLKQRDLLNDIRGLTWYSWKDTGISDALDQLPLISVQDQAGHSKPEMTLRYRSKRGRNRRFQKEFRNELE